MTPAAGGGLPVLTYHGFSARRSVTTVEPAWFVETIDRLVGAGFRCVDLGAWVASGRPDARGAFALAFDDGLASVLEVAHEVTRRKLPATIFVTTDRVGRDNAWPGQPRSVPRERVLDWDELAVLARRGFRIGSHGTSHRPLDRLPAADREQELRRGRDAVEKRIGVPCPLLAYPYGASNPAIRLEAARHYAAAFGTRLGYTDSRQDPFDLRRIDACYLAGAAELEALAGDRWRAWLARRDRLRECRRRVTAFLPAGIRTL